MMIVYYLGRGFIRVFFFIMFLIMFTPYVGIPMFFLKTC